VLPVKGIDGGAAKATWSRGFRRNFSPEGSTPQFSSALLIFVPIRGMIVIAGEDSPVIAGRIEINRKELDNGNAV